MGTGDHHTTTLAFLRKAGPPHRRARFLCASFACPPALLRMMMTRFGAENFSACVARLTKSPTPPRTHVGLARKVCISRALLSSCCRLFSLVVLGQPSA